VQRNLLKSNTADTQQEERRVRHFTLSGLLPQGVVIAIHLDLETATCLVIRDGMPREKAQAILTTSELQSVLPLFEAYPHYCPHEVLHALFFYGSTEEKTVQACRKLLLEAQESGAWEMQIRPFRSAISRARFKLRPIGLDIGSL
jgi:hypothetical protein